MAKVVVFCADGTWDGAENVAGSYPSNVLKLFGALAGNLTVGVATDPEQELQLSSDGELAQSAKYIHGVGDSRNWLAKNLGGGLGTGLLARLLRGYTFLSRNYAPGDAIVLIGFSRGAYTARALGGFVSTVGLLDWKTLGLNPEGSDIRGYQFAAAAWYRYQQLRLHTSENRYWLGCLENFVTEIPQLAAGLALTPDYVPGVEVHAIGVWDTVGALGIPELSADHASRLDVLRFVDTKLSTNVQHGFHAIAADEERIDFSPTLWDPDPSRIVQCLFPGAHADVGGGYPAGEESRLSDLALDWMSLQLSECGVRFSSRPCAAPASELGPMHLPWTSAAFSLRPRWVREFPNYGDASMRITLHPSLCSRLGKSVSTVTATTPPVRRTVPYLPLSLVNSGYLDVTSVRANP